jgi:hypothetical protein
MACSRAGGFVFPLERIHHEGTKEKQGVPLMNADQKEQLEISAHLR